MSGRWRNLLGGIAILIFLAAYVWVAVIIADYLPDHWAARLAYFAVAGVSWGLPLIPLLSWMGGERPKSGKHR